MAISQGVVSGQDAALIALTRLGGMRIAELARQRGASASTLSSRRRRAEAAIRRHLMERSGQEERGGHPLIRNDAGRDRG